MSQKPIVNAEVIVEIPARASVARGIWRQISYTNYSDSSTSSSQIEQSIEGESHGSKLEFVPPTTSDDDRTTNIDKIVMHQLLKRQFCSLSADYLGVVNEAEEEDDKEDDSLLEDSEQEDHGFESEQFK